MRCSESGELFLNFSAHNFCTLQWCHRKTLMCLESSLYSSIFSACHFVQSYLPSWFVLFRLEMPALTSEVMILRLLLLNLLVWGKGRHNYMPVSERALSTRAVSWTDVNAVSSTNLAHPKRDSLSLNSERNWKKSWFLSLTLAERKGNIIFLSGTSALNTYGGVPFEKFKLPWKRISSL